MSQKANPTLIGLFFVAGMALGLGALLTFSSRSLFHPQHKDILYFNASLKGLSPGAPVKYRGVAIGSVVEIYIRHNQATDDFSMPVVISIDKELAQSKSDQALQIGSPSQLKQMISEGFRGRMEAESLVTGVLNVGLEIVSNAPPPTFHQLQPELEEIPTIPSDVQQLLANLAHLDARGLSEKLSSLLEHLDTSLSELDVPAINAGVVRLLDSANRVVAAPDLTNSLTALHQTLDHAKTLLTHVDGRVDPLVDSVTNTLADAQQTLIGLRAGIRNYSDLVGPDSALRPELLRALKRLNDASAAVADLADFLKRNPNALLTGKKPEKEQP